MTSNTPLFQAANITVVLGGTPIFTHLSFDVLPGEHLALTGANGTGKSTLLQLMSTDRRLSQIVTHKNTLDKKENNGCIRWGFSGTLESSALAAKDHVRLVAPAQQSEHTRQGWKITGKEIILSGFFGTPLLYSSPSAEQIHTAELLCQKAGLTYLLKINAPAMSQGQLRATLLMRALVKKPRLLLLDEPFDGLDTASRAALTRLMHIATKDGSTLVVTAHRPQDIPPFIIQRCSLQKNKLVPLHTHNEKTSSPSSHPSSCFMQEKDFIDLLAHQHTSFTKSNAATFCFVDVDVFIDRKKVLDKINWTVQKKEHWVITGRNGSGKSTLLRLIYGEESIAWGGSISWYGKGRIPLPELHEFIGYVSDSLHHRYMSELTAEEVIISGRKGTIGLYTLPTKEEHALAKAWLERLGILSIASTPYNVLSSGLARRVLLARALCWAPPLLLLDEPFSGLDQQSREHFLQILPILAASGRQLIFVSHHSSDYQNMFTHELALAEGEIIYNGLLRQ